MTDIFSLIDPGVLSGAVKHRHAPKLDAVGRRAAIAACRAGYNKQAVSEVFGLHPQTVAYMRTSNPRHYRTEKAEYDGLGHTAFIQRYLKEHHVIALNAVVQKQTDMRKMGINVPNHNARTKQGKHVLDDGTVIQVRWLDVTADISVAGWYWGEGEMGSVTDWFGPQPSSAAAFNDAKNSMV